MFATHAATTHAAAAAAAAALGGASGSNRVSRPSSSHSSPSGVGRRLEQSRLRLLGCVSLRTFVLAVGACVLLANLALLLLLSSPANGAPEHTPHGGPVMGTETHAGATPVRQTQTLHSTDPAAPAPGAAAAAAAASPRLSQASLRMLRNHFDSKNGAKRSQQQQQQQQQQLQAALSDQQPESVPTGVAAGAPPSSASASVSVVDPPSVRLASSADRAVIFASAETFALEVLSEHVAEPLIMVAFFGQCLATTAPDSYKLQRMALDLHSSCMHACLCGRCRPS